MTSPFDYVNSISTNKTNMMRETENDTLAEKDYNPWIVNKALSYFPDTILLANDMNINHTLDKRPQYEYLLNATRQGKRWAKWVKEDKSGDVNTVMLAYNCSSTVAREYLTILTKAQLDQIRQSLQTGGSQ